MAEVGDHASKDTLLQLKSRAFFSSTGKWLESLPDQKREEVLWTAMRKKTTENKRLSADEKSNKMDYHRQPENSGAPVSTPTPTPVNPTPLTPTTTRPTTPTNVYYATTPFQPFFIRNKNFTEAVEDLPLMIEGPGRAYYWNPGKLFFFNKNNQ